MLSVVLVAIACSSCGSLPQSPELMQCGFSQDQNDLTKSFWACVSNKDPNKTERRELGDPRMHGSQALDLDDFEKSQDYFDELRKRLIDALDKINADFMRLKQDTLIMFGKRG